MNSKEALEHIIFDAKMEKPIFSMYYQEFLKPIEKDLEVLEILKRMVIVRKGTTWYYLDTEHPFFESQEDIDKVKEWLENGKTN